MKSNEEIIGQYCYLSPHALVLLYRFVANSLLFTAKVTEIHMTYTREVLYRRELLYRIEEELNSYDQMFCPII